MHFVKGNLKRCVRKVHLTDVHDAPFQLMELGVLIPHQVDSHRREVVAALPPTAELVQVRSDRLPMVVSTSTTVGATPRVSRPLTLFRIRDAQYWAVRPLQASSPPGRVPNL